MASLRRFFRRNLFRRQAGFHRAAVAQMPGQGASVNSLHAGDVPFLQIFIERHFRAPVAWNFAQLFDDKSA